MNKVNELFTWYETLAPDTLKEIKNFYDQDLYFKDPFNEVKGVDKLIGIYSDMFENLENPRFIFIDKIMEGEQIFVTWNFNFILRQKEYCIHGSSHLKLNDKMLIVYHRDYWDVGEELLLKLPIIKNLYSVLKSKLGSS